MAVPKSTITASSAIPLIPAQSQIISAPTVLGSSTFNATPVLIPGPKIKGSFLYNLTNTFFKALVITGTTDEIFNNPIHPYTKSLLSAIPHPNPKVEKQRIAMEYDKDKEGVDYLACKIHTLSETHQVLATDEEFKKWSTV